MVLICYKNKISNFTLLYIVFLIKFHLFFIFGNFICQSNLEIRGGLGALCGYNKFLGKKMKHSKAKIKRELLARIKEKIY